MRRLSAIFLLLSIIILTIGVFYPSLQNDFTNWDDPLHITENIGVTSLQWDTALKHFVPTTEYMYHPLTMVLYSIEWNLGDGNPYLFHAVSVLLHLLNIVLVFLLCRMLMKESVPALAVALIFALHPLNVEAVAWISGRKDILFAFFFLAGMNLYARYVMNHSTALLIFVYIVFVFGLLSKPTMVVFPLSLFLIGRWQDRSRTMKALAVDLAPFFALSFIYALFTLWLSANDPTAVATVELYSPVQRISLITASLVFYVGKFFAPIGLSALYGYPMIRMDLLPLWYYASPFLLTVIFFIIWYFRKTPLLLFGVGLYFIPLLLVSQIVPFHNSSLVADRYAYISTIGLALITVQGVRSVMVKIPGPTGWWNTFRMVILCTAAVMCIILSMERVTVWKNGETLFSDVIEKNREIWLAFGNRAAARIAHGDFNGAVDDGHQAIRLHPKSGILFFNRGNAYKGLERFDDALADYDSAIALGYRKHTVFFNKANTLFALDRFDSAYANYILARNAEPMFPQTYVHLGYLTFHTYNNFPAAIAYFDTALTLFPPPNEALYYRADAYYRLNQFGLAMDDLSRSIALFPALVNDPLVPRINASIDSVRQEIERMDRLIDNEPFNRDYRIVRGRNYLLLGDSLRGERDRRAGEKSPL